MKRCLLLLFALPLCLVSSYRACAAPVAALTAQADAVQPFNLPMIVHLTIKNTGQEPFEYLTGGPGRYPGAQLFSATLKSASGRTYRTQMMDDTLVYPYNTSNMPPGNAVEIYNGQYWRMLSACINVPINPGDLVDVPIALSPMPPGNYTITFSSGQDVFGKWPKMTASPISVIIKQDETLLAAGQQALLRQAGAGDSFAQRVVARYNVRIAIEVLLIDLTSNDIAVAQHAADTLSGVRYLPPNASDTISAALLKNVHGMQDDHASASLEASLAPLAVKAQSAATAAALAAVAQNDANTEARFHATVALGQFQLPSAIPPLRGLLNDPDPGVRGAAAVALAQSHEEAALPVLLALVDKTGGDIGWNNIYIGLAQFPKDSQARAALQAGLDSKDIRIRMAAQQAQELYPNITNSASNRP